jgi:hypothetical protein
VVAVAALAGCITGERPVLEPETAVNDPAIETVLDRLGRAASGEFTAVYDIFPSTTGATTTATVIRLENGRTLVTIGDVEYLIDGSVTRTCVGNDCVDRIDDARISNLNITHRFWGESFAARLELDAARNLSDGRGRIDTIAGRPAACVDIEVVGGTPTYCALDAGVLARYYGADVSIELTSYSTTAEADAFER